MKIKHPDIYFERYAHSGGKRVEKGGELYVCDQCGEMFRNSKVTLNV